MGYMWYVSQLSEKIYSVPCTYPGLLLIVQLYNYNKNRGWFKYQTQYKILYWVQSVMDMHFTNVVLR